MIRESTRKGISEVLYILQHTSKDDVDRIPERFMEFLKGNVLEGYEPHFELKSDVKDMDITLETKCILALIYKEYWCTSEEKMKFEEILRRHDVENSKRDLLNKSNNNLNSKEETTKAEVQIAAVSDSLFTRLYKIVKEKLYKIFKH